MPCLFVFSSPIFACSKEKVADKTYYSINYKLNVYSHQNGAALLCSEVPQRFPPKRCCTAPLWGTSVLPAETLQLSVSCAVLPEAPLCLLTERCCWPPGGISSPVALSRLGVTSFPSNAQHLEAAQHCPYTSFSHAGLCACTVVSLRSVMAVPRAHRHSSEGESHQVLHKVMAFFILYHGNSLSHVILPVLLC